MPVPYGRVKSGGNPALHCLAPLQSLLARLTGVALAPPELSEAAGPQGDKPTAGSRPPFRPASKHAFNPQKHRVPYAPGAENRQKLTARMALPAWCHTKFRNLTNHIRVRCWHSFYLALHFLHHTTLSDNDCLGCMGKRYAKPCGVQSRFETRAYPTPHHLHHALVHTANSEFGENAAALAGRSNTMRLQS